MRVQVDNGQNARFWLETQHSLIIGSILPGNTVNQIDTLVILNVVAMNVTCHEDIGYFDDQSVFGFRR